ncbi:MAG: HAMP domain-containing protein [Methylophilaceae bacterium]|nr:HAMP domain-containing protein [Methylophilaceae bacterium]
MGRLFWKFFFFFWLAQVFTSFGVGLAIWALRPEPSQVLAPPELPPPSPDGRYDLRPPPPNGEPGSGPRPPRSDGFLPPLLPIFAGSAASFIFAALLAWYFARPIRTLRTAFVAVANGKLGTRIGISMGGRQDELADLGQDFDRMASRLQNLMDAQRRLLHDISHELRSPLARLQAATDLMQQQPDRATEFITRIERDTSRINTLVGELLTLARLDSGMAGRMDETVDVRKILDHICDDAYFEAESKHCLVNVNLPENIYILGNQELLFRALENIVRNAVLHSPPGGEIGVSAMKTTDLKTTDVKASDLKATEPQWIITISDNGSGVPAEYLDAIFEPFFRGTTNQQTGYGLGLAITHRVVQAHGGTISAINRAEGGFAISVTLNALKHAATC